MGVPIAKAESNKRVENGGEEARQEDLRRWLRFHGKPVAPKLPAEQTRQLRRCFELIDDNGEQTPSKILPRR